SWPASTCSSAGGDDMGRNATLPVPARATARAVAEKAAPAAVVDKRRRNDPPLVRWGLTVAAVAVVFVLIVIPVVNVFYQALAQAPGTYWLTLVLDADTRAAILLTLTVAPVAVALNLVFGVAAAWAIARFRFPGRTLLMTLIDLPFSVSPVVA